MKIFIPSRNLILATAIFLVYIVPLRAQNNPQDYLDAHNKARAEVGVGPLTFDYSLAAQASFSAFSRSLLIDAFTTQGTEGGSGYNIAIVSSTTTGVEAVEMWVNQKSDYDYNSNTCAPTKNCSSFTQLAWGNSAKIGCAISRSSSFKTVVICYYDPPGNVNGERPF